MADVGDLWSGEDWQTYCNELLSLRYDLEYQPVPDRDKGDWGIEGFTKGGAFFQCYAAQNPRSLDELYEKQRDKMTVDLGKMERNLAAITPLVTPAEIAYWTLLVPRCETKRLLQHAQRKAEDIRARTLPGIKADFVIRVWTDQEFETEKRKLSAIGTALLPQPPVTIPSAADLEQWKEEDTQSHRVLDEKLQKLPHLSSTQDRADLRDELIRQYLMGSSRLDQIRRTNPALWERLNHEQQQRERTLGVERLATPHSDQPTIATVAERFQGTIESAIPALKGGSAETLAWGTVADWLIRCPLEPAP